MASAAEQLAQNMNFGAFAQAKELQKRILFTLLVLVIYRVGTFVPVPGIDPAQFALAFQQQSQGVLGMFNMMSGGAVERILFARNRACPTSLSAASELIPTARRESKARRSGRSCSVSLPRVQRRERISSRRSCK